MLNSPLTKFNVLTTQPKDNENGLVGWWTFDDGTATDFSGNQNNGTPTNTPTPASGIIGNALKFNGTNNYVISNNVINIGYLTLSIWIKGAPATGTFWLICGFANGLNNSTFDKVVHIGSTGLIGWYIYNGSGVSIYGTVVGQVTDGNWHHIAATYGAGAQNLYVDGLLVATGAGGAPSYTGYTVPNFFVNGTINGQYVYSAFTEDDVRIYNRALGPDEIFALYARGLSAGQGQPEGELPALRLALASTIQRRTLSALGTHIGSRQMQG